MTWLWIIVAFIAGSDHCALAHQTRLRRRAPEYRGLDLAHRFLARSGACLRGGIIGCDRSRECTR